MTEPQVEVDAAVPKSTFVTVLAWIFIIGSAFSTFVGLLQSLVFGSMQAQFSSAFQDSTFAGQAPHGFQFFFSHFELFILIMLALSVATLVSSIGLLRRRNWARLAFIGVMVLGVLYFIVGLFFQQSMMSDFQVPAAQNAQAQAFEAQWRHSLHVMQVFMVVLSVAMVGLFGWIIARLSSAPVRAEFASSARAA
jgi:nitrate reductase NapE component